MSTLRKPKPTTAQVAASRAAKHDKPPIHLMPSALEQRRKMFDERLKAMQQNCQPQGRICNSTMGTEPYVPGDGEVLQATRPGAMHAYTMPSRGVGT